MKKIYLIISLIIFAVFQAQIVNIPDANFKAKLLAANTTNNQMAYNASNQSVVIDTNGDSEIQVSEALLIKGLALQPSYTAPITNLEGIKGFSNLSTLSLTGSSMKITSADFSNMASLTELYFNQLPQLTSFNITNCNTLNFLSLSGCNAITSLNLVSPLTKLQISWCSNFTSLDLTGAPNITNFNLTNTKVSSLNLSNLNALSNFQVTQNSLLTSINFQGSNNIYEALFQSNPLLTSIDLSGKSLMWKVACEGNTTLNNLNVSGCSALQRIAVNNSNGLHTINLTGLSQIQILDFLSTGINNLNLADLPLLGYFRCKYGQLSSIDFSHNPLISQIDINSNTLQMINLKNGGQNFPWDFNIGSNSSMQYMCCDIEDTSAATSILNQFGYPNAHVNSYCSFTPGGTFYTIQGNTRYDLNTNGCDSSDPAKAFQKFTITNGTTVGNIIANTTGSYSIPVQAGTHTITPILENPAYWSVSPSTLTASFPTQISPLTQNFCITANGNHNDLETVIIPITVAAPGFDAKYKIIYKNKGTSTQSGTLGFTYNDNISDYVSATTAPNSQSTGILNWNFTNLLPFETKEITVTIHLNTPTQTPPLTSGNILHYTVQINGATDDTPLDNIFTLNQTVVNSFDPNDKTCLEGPSITQVQVGDYVHYLIRFENTGTANAQNIVVKDEIDTSKFDLSTLVPLNASHNFVTRITNPNTVEFIFENIQLPFNNATNDGYVSFKIKTKSTLTIGNSFSNTAKIYFDYNFPIITNTYTTTVQNVLATNEINKGNNDITIYPNPVKDLLNIQSKNEIVKAEIYDATGRILRTTSLNNNIINVSDLTKGNYVIKLSTKDKIMTQKFIKN
jgi:hypothetical protein